MLVRTGLASRRLLDVVAGIAIERLISAGTMPNAGILADEGPRSMQQVYHATAGEPRNRRASR